MPSVTFLLRFPEFLSGFIALWGAHVKMKSLTREFCDMKSARTESAWTYLSVRSADVEEQLTRDQTVVADEAALLGGTYSWPDVYTCLQTSVNHCIHHPMFVY